MLRLFLLALAPLMCCAEFRPLFNGRNLEGWVHEGPRMSFSAEKGELVVSGRGNPPNWLRTAAEYEDFRLRFEYKLEEWAEAGVYLRAPRAGWPSRAGLGLFLAHDFHREVTKYDTGALTGALPPVKRPAPSWGVWHSVEIELVGERLKAKVDDSVVQDVDLAADAELRQRLKRGYIGFPDSGYGWRLRNIEIEELGSPTKFLEPFDRRTLNGWRLRNEGMWSVRDGAIYGANGHGILYAPTPELLNFELTMLVRSHNQVNSGVFLRGDVEGPRRGFEVQIYSPLDTVFPTGSIYNLARSKVSAEYDGRWFLMQIRVEGPRCVVRLDGETVAEYERLSGEALKPGRIGLQIHREDSAVEFKDLRIRVLP
ncbi:MAG: DUF1080 domain-containing protein [Bryobacteraceae bacterium]|nr:DUF1080 domain-containing protein [Bryobacteraceae bacterium]